MEDTLDFSDQSSNIITINKHIIITTTHNKVEVKFFTLVLSSP